VLLQGQSGCPAGTPDFTLTIQNVTIELARDKTILTIGYNGSAPGPLLRIPEGKDVTIDVRNETSVPELVHWHGLHIPSDVDGSMEEGTPMIPPRECRRYRFTAAPSGTRWYHTHTMAMRNLSRSSYKFWRTNRHVLRLSGEEVLDVHALDGPAFRGANVP
jgi:FtsP/CotA-like multicopper oxidase with cupredoxin domain